METRSYHNEAKPNMEIPVLEEDGRNYDSWKLRIDIWCDISRVKKSEQARMLQSKLGETAFNTTKHMDSETLKSDDGVKALITKLDELYIPDKLHHGRDVYEKYREIRRQENESVVLFIQKFLSLYKDVQKFNPDMQFYGEAWAALDLLSSCKLSKENKKIVTAQMKYPPCLNNLIDILKRVFTAEKSDNTSNSSSNNDQDNSGDIFLAKSANIVKNESSLENQHLDRSHASFYTRDQGRNTYRPSYRPPQRGRAFRGNNPYYRNDNRNY